jgi:hypothetical protein
MKKICFLSCLFAALIVVLNTAALAGQDVAVKATQGKATDWRYPDTTITETRLATRNASPDARKSWLQFDLTAVYAQDPSIKGNFINAKLTFYGAKAEVDPKSYVVNGLNDSAGLENWVATSLTWNNAPANNITSSNLLDTTKVTSIYTGTFPPPCQDIISETPEADRAALTTFLNTDTDGKVTFIFTGGGTAYFKNVGDLNGEPVLTVTYVLGNNPEKAHFPIPADGAEVKTTLSSLSWTNPDPNAPSGVITCDVYLGTEPNRLSMDKKTLAAGITSVVINAANFPTYATLIDQQTYYWIVDVHDTSEPNVITGQDWHFDVNNNNAPVVSAGPDQVVWLGKSGIPGQEVVYLDGTTSDDDLPNPPKAYSVLWTQVSGPATITIDPNNVNDTSVTITATGVYVFQLTADDTNKQASDTVQVVVGTNSCHASYLNGAAYNAMDFNTDCTVNFADFADFAADWLTCTNSFEECL